MVRSSPRSRIPDRARLSQLNTHDRMSGDILGDIQSLERRDDVESVRTSRTSRGTTKVVVRSTTLPAVLRQLINNEKGVLNETRSNGPVRFEVELYE